jgi:hypothetical protein
MSNNYTLIFTDSAGLEHEIAEFDRPSAEDFEYIDKFIKTLKEDVRRKVTFASEYAGDDDFLDDYWDEDFEDFDEDDMDDEDFDDHDHVPKLEDLLNLNYIENSFKLYEEYYA